MRLKEVWFINAWATRGVTHRARDFFGGITGLLFRNLN